MSKVTSKLQVTVPKVIADEYGIRPGDQLQWAAAGEAIRVIPGNGRRTADGTLSLEDRLDLFDKATQRQSRRQTVSKRKGAASAHSGERGWKREDLYRRGLAD